MTEKFFRSFFSLLWAGTEHITTRISLSIADLKRYQNDKHIVKSSLNHLIFNCLIRNCRKLAICIVRKHWFEKFFGSLTEEFLRPYQKSNSLNTPLRQLFRILLLIDLVSSHESVFRGVHFVRPSRSAENDLNINLLYFWTNFLSCANRLIQK